MIRWGAVCQVASVGVLVVKGFAVQDGRSREIWETRHYTKP